jgi:AcrR family transcriptional regulator
LFLELGFSHTTITAVAERAGVAPETVYSIYRTKAGVLDAVVRGAVRRNKEPEDPLERVWVKRLQRLPDVAARITGFARHTAETTELTSHLRDHRISPAATRTNSTNFREPLGATPARSTARLHLGTNPRKEAPAVRDLLPAEQAESVSMGGVEVIFRMSGQETDGA